MGQSSRQEEPHGVTSGGRFHGREGEGCEFGRCHSEVRLEEICSSATGFDTEGSIRALLQGVASTFLMPLSAR